MSQGSHNYPLHCKRDVNECITVKCYSNKQSEGPSLLHLLQRPSPGICLHSDDDSAGLEGPEILHFSPAPGHHCWSETAVKTQGCRAVGPQTLLPWKPPGEYKRVLIPPTPRYSDAIGLGCELGIGIFIAPPPR